MTGSGIAGAGRWPGAALVLVSTLLPVALPGCQGDESSSSTEIFCAAMCERATQCGGWSQASECERQCESDPAGLEDYRPEFISEFAACFRGLSCNVFFEADSLDPCWDEAREGFEANADTRVFCSDRSRVWFECGFSYFPDECERDWAPNSAAALDRVAECHHSVACDQLASCTEAALRVGQ